MSGNYVNYSRPLSQIGFRPMRVTHPAQAAALSGIGSLGDDSATLAGLGFSSAQISQILSAYQSGALSDGGYQALVSGFVDPSQLADFLAADPGATTTAAAATGASAAGVPTGTSLTYQASIPAQLFSSSGVPAFLSSLNGVLGPLGIEVVGSSSSSAGLMTFTIQLQLLITGAGFAKAQDVQADVDHAVYTLRGQLPTSSSIAISGLPGAATALPSTSDIGTWIEQNMTMILLGIAAIVVLPTLVKKL